MFKLLFSHIRSGLCSGFPICCIIYYVTVWYFFLMDNQSSLAVRLRKYRKINNEPCYIRCPLCRIFNNRVVTKICLENPDKCFCGGSNTDHFPPSWIKIFINNETEATLIVEEIYKHIDVESYLGSKYRLIWSKNG